MTAFVIVEILEVLDEETYATYRAAVGATLAQAGGRYLARGNEIAVLEGAWQPRRLILVQFPSAEAAQGWWAGAGYRELKAMRQRSTQANMILIEGVRDVTC